MDISQTSVPKAIWPSLVIVIRSEQAHAWILLMLTVKIHTGGEGGGKIDPILSQ